MRQRGQYRRTMQATAIEIRPSSVEEVWLRAGPLMEAHWREIMGDQCQIALQQDWERYRALEAAGSLFVLAAWDGGVIVGYSFTLLYQHLQCDVFGAQNDALYVTPSHRGRGYGSQLIHETVRAARERGATRWTWHAPRDSALAKLLLRLGYTERETIYDKGL